MSRAIASIQQEENADFTFVLSVFVHIQTAQCVVTLNLSNITPTDLPLTHRGDAEKPPESLQMSSGMNLINLLTFISAQRTPTLSTNTAGRGPNRLRLTCPRITATVSGSSKNRSHVNTEMDSRWCKLCGREAVGIKECQVISVEAEAPCEGEIYSRGNRTVRMEMMDGC